MTRTAFESFLSSLQAWLQAARDEEIIALRSLVAAEMAARKLAPPAPETPPSHAPPDIRAGEEGKIL